MEVVNGDSMNVKMGDGSVKKIFLASVRPPRAAPAGAEGDKEDPRKKIRER